MATIKGHKDIDVGIAGIDKDIIKIWQKHDDGDYSNPDFISFPISRWNDLKAAIESAIAGASKE